MANNHISNEVLPPEERVINDYHEADNRLNSLVNYLKDCIQSVQNRRAYVVPAGKWSLQGYTNHRAEQRKAAGKLIIDRNYYSTMGPAKTEQLDEDFSWKATARPNINSELGWAFNLEGSDPRSTRTSVQSVIDLTEKKLVELRKDKKSKNNFHKLHVSVIGEGVFELSKEDFHYLKSQVGGKSIWFEQSVQVLLRKKEFAEMLLNRPARQHEPLKQILEPDYVFEPSPHIPLAENQWIELKDPTIMGTEQQREFVEKALNGKDFTIVWGPAGSGKTTAICEFIKQAVRNNKKVLMVGSTHIAVDNVLEKFARGEARPLRDDEPGVIAVRVGRPAKVSEYVKPLLIENFINTKRQALQKHLKPLAGSKKAEAAAASRMLECVDDDQADGIMQAILMGANLVCGTTIGILQHPAVKLARDTGSYPDFDYLILDEASKTTLDEFLVPAMCAKRWIVVGDPYQLAPFCEEAELGASLLTAIMSRTPKNSDPTSGITFVDPGSPKVRKQLQDAIKASLEERSVRFQDDDFTKQMLERKNTALEYLSGHYVLNQNKEAVTLLENTQLAMAIALPSILESLVGEAEGLPAAGSIVRPLKEGLDSRMVKLKYQHRMPRHVADFAKNYVYKGRMLITPDNAKEKPRLHSQEDGHEGRLVVLTAEDKAECLTQYQNRERESAEQLVLAVKELLDFAKWAKLNPKRPEEDPWRAYLISTYKNQNHLCQRLVEHLYESHGDIFNCVEIEASTVDSCQGHEADLVLLSLVRDNQTPFMRSLNRMNVAFTRAKSRMVILGDMPSWTTEAQKTGQACTMLDALHEYPVTRIETKNLKESVTIVNNALKS